MQDPRLDAHGHVDDRLAIRMFLLFAAPYVLSYAFRTISAVIAPRLIDDLDLSAADLGLLSSAYFLAFALMQLPVGLLLDRFGPRKVESALMLVAALGAFLFSYSQSFATLWVARALIGVGVSACLMAAVQAYALFFKPHLQASMSSWMLVAGSMGALSVTTPVDHLLPLIGWRGVFAGMSVLCLLGCAGLWWGQPRLFRPGKTTSFSELAAGYKAVFSHPHFWRVAPLATFQQGGFMAFHGLWMGPWLTQVQGMSSSAAAQALFEFSLVLMLGYLSLGLLTRRVAMRGGDVDLIMVVGIALNLVIGATQIFTGGALGMPGWLAYAVASSGAIMTYTIANKPFPKALAGRSSTGLNLLIFAGAFGLQWGIGIGIDHFTGQGMDKAQALRHTLTVLLVLQTLSWLWFARPGRKTSHLVGQATVR